MSSALELPFLFFGVVLPLLIGAFFVVAVWRRKTGLALLAAGLIVLSTLIPVVFPPSPGDHASFSITVQDIAISSLEAALPLAVIAFIVRAIRTRKKGWAMAARMLLLVILAPFIVAFAAVAFLPASARNTNALFDKMQEQHVAGWEHFVSTTQTEKVAGWSSYKLLKQYGPPIYEKADRDAIMWSYSANPWYFLSFDYVDVWIQHGRVTAISMESL